MNITRIFGLRIAVAVMVAIPLLGASEARSQWTTLPVAYTQEDGSFRITNRSADNFARWAAMSGVRVFTGDFDGNGRTDVALVRQEPDWNTLPVAYTQ